MHFCLYLLVLIVPLSAGIQVDRWRKHYNTRETVECGRADIVFVLDRSNSLSNSDFRRQIVFVNEFVQEFDLRENMTHIGVMTFANNSDVHFQMDEKHGRDAISEAILAITRAEGARTDTYEAIDLMRSDMFSSSHVRSGVPHIAVVVTDGKSHKKEKTAIASQAAHHAGITMFAIGVGTGPDQEELGTIASRPDYVFNVDDYSSLHQIMNTLAQTTCEVEPVEIVEPEPVDPTEIVDPEPVEPVETVEPERECGRADIVFVLDRSSSLSNSDFRRQIEFVGEFVQEFDLTEGVTHVGIMTFANNSDVHFHLDEKHGREDISQAISAITRAEGARTDTYEAIDLMRTDMFASPHARNGVPRIAIVVTDGKTHGKEKTAIASQAAHDAGITMFAIGVGTGPDQEELEIIASSPDYVFNVNDYSSLHEIINTVAKTACKVEPVENEQCETGCADYFTADIKFAVHGRDGATGFVELCCKGALHGEQDVTCSRSCASP